MVEQWKKLDIDVRYYVSNKGRIYSTVSKRILKPRKVGGNYRQVTIATKQFLVHRLVAMMFIPNPDNLPCVNHKDENPSNNDVSNLEWCTHKYNSNYGTNPKRRSKQMLERYTKDSDWKQSCIDRLQEVQNKKRKKVVQLDLDGAFVKLYESSYSTELDGHKNTHVSDCANGKRITHHNYRWMWLDDYLKRGGVLS